MYALDFQNLINDNNGDNEYRVDKRILEECKHGNFYLDIFQKLKNNVTKELVKILGTDQLPSDVLQLCMDYVTMHDSHSSSLAAVYSYDVHPCKIDKEIRHIKRLSNDFDKRNQHELKSSDEQKQVLSDFSKMQNQLLSKFSVKQDQLLLELSNQQILLLRKFSNIQKQLLKSSKSSNSSGRKKFIKRRMSC